MKRLLMSAAMAIAMSGFAMAQNGMGSHPDTRPNRSHCSATSTPTCEEEAKVPARWWSDQDDMEAVCYHYDASPDRDRKIDACLKIVRRAH